MQSDAGESFKMPNLQGSGPSRDQYFKVLARLGNYRALVQGQVKEMKSHTIRIRLSESGQQ